MITEFDIVDAVAIKLRESFETAVISTDLDTNKVVERPDHKDQLIISVYPESTEIETESRSSDSRISMIRISIFKSIDGKDNDLDIRNLSVHADTVLTALTRYTLHIDSVDVYPVGVLKDKIFDPEFLVRNIFHSQVVVRYRW